MKQFLQGVFFSAVIFIFLHFLYNLPHLCEQFTGTSALLKSLIDSTMCYGGRGCCSWKYIICNFSWVNIAGSLVKRGDKLFWEKKYCPFFLKAGKKFASTSWKI
ncbi:hypothetical protein ILYODFUR_024741 [Ilyodon furcidens]|uniref:Uncharacterized protein n=1 Tax=Ilyodon furcidens TaxID=33524 RepID=A0ABV0SZW8_9TELE